MSNQKMENGVEDQEALFHSYPFAYFVQSPSTVSHANSADIRNSINNEYSACHSPLRSETFLNNVPTNPNPEASRFTLSRYSSSHGSNNSFVHEKNKIAYDDRSHGTGIENGQNRLIIVDGKVGDHDDDDEDDDDYEEEYYGRKRGWWKRYFTYRSSDSCVWIALQISWRAMLSLGVALLVFYLATKPPTPKLSVKIVGIRQFVLGEGVDATGVATKMLTCNCSIDLVIENKSKLFGLHIHPPIMDMSFGRLPFAISHGPKLYTQSGTTRYRMYVGTRNKPMYGAGRSMQDMLESGVGLPLVLRVRLSTSFRVVWNLVKPKFHHRAECLLVLDGAYDKKHRTQVYNSSCAITS